MTHWMHPPEIERTQVRDTFDAVLAGARHGLAPQLALAIWDRVRVDATDASGRQDLDQARQRFHEIAARVAARGRLRADIGRRTRVGDEIDDRSQLTDELMDPVPGRDTLVAFEARRSRQLRRLIDTEPGASADILRAAVASVRHVDLGGDLGRLRDTAARADHADALRGAPTLARHIDLGRLFGARSVRGDGRVGRPNDAGRADVHHAPASVIAGHAVLVREAVRLYRAGELADALRRGDPGLADAVATALHQGSILAPHPVDQWRDSVRGLGADLTTAGRSFGRAALRFLGAAPIAPVGQRAFAFADAVSGGAARAWSDRARGWADGMARRAMAFRDGAAAHGVEDELAKLPTAGGAHLPPAVRARMEALFGHRFAHVRIHTDAAAVQAAEAAGARAVTIGSNIYFNRDQFAPGTEAGDRLLLHELTHVVQHDEGRLPDPASGRVELSSPSDPAEREARAMESRVGEMRAEPAVSPAHDAPANGSAPAPSTTAAPTAPPAANAARPFAPSPLTAGRPAPASDPRGGKRASPDIFGDAAHWVGDRVDDAKNWAADQIEGLVLKAAPGLATLIKEGPGGLIKNAIQPAIQGWVGNLTGGVDVFKLAGQLKGSFTSAFAVLQGAKAGDPKCCETLVNGINAIRQVATAFMDNPVFDAIKGVFTKVSEIVGTVTKLVIGPAFEVLKSLIGGAWDAIQGVAHTIQGWINTVKNIASAAFDWVAKKLGFPSGSGEGGLLDWLKQKAIEIWEDIKKTLQPVIGPLKVIGGVLLLCTGLPQIYAIIKYGPQIVDAIKWLWENRNNPDAVKKNPGGIGGSILPKILGAGQSFVATIKSGVSWLVDKISAFATGALNLLGAITGVPLLDMARGFVQGIVDGVKGIQDWATGAFTTAAESIEGLFHKVADFIKPYAEVLCSVATAVVNPVGIPGILAGWAWRWLPDCIKPPLIDLLLDAVIGFLRGMPSLPMLGPLWPLLKSGVIGFLEAVRAKDDQTKIKVSNKIAKIISGASPAFLFGFVKGLLKGVWDGIKMPFEAIWMIVKGIEKAGDFFVALGNDAESQSRPRPAQPAATAPGGTPTPTTHATPSAPSVITPDQASSVVGGIVSQLNAQKPPPRTQLPTTGTQPAPGAGNDYQQLAHEAKRMGGELAGPGKTVATGFMPAIKELFSGGKGMSLDDLIAKLNKVWEAAKSAVAKLGGQIANMIIDFLMKDSAEEEIGDAIGYLVGMIAFQAVLDAFTVGAWTDVSVVLTAIAKFLNWPMKFLGEAMGLMKKLGGFILDGLKSLGKMVAEAGAGALREVTGALRQIAGKLGEFADEILAKFGGKGANTAENTAAHSLEGDAAKTLEKDAAGTAERDAAAAKNEGKPGETKPNEASVAEKEAQKAEEFAEAMAISKTILRAEDAGHMPGPAIAVSLDGLKGRYSWIKVYEARPSGRGFQVFMIASENFVGETHPGGVEGKPEGERPKTEPGDGKLTPQQEARYQELTSRWQAASEKDLRELKELREAKGELSFEPNTPEHKLDRWERYKEYKAAHPEERALNWDPPPKPGWSNQYHTSIRNGTEPLAREKDYAQLLNGRSRVFKVEGMGNRQVDVFVEEQNAMYQIKTGFEDLTTVQHGGQLPNLEAIRRDRALIEQGYEVTWVLEKGGSKPLLKELAGPPEIKVVTGTGFFDRLAAGLP